ncbi:MAG: cofactor-independent phosphoglycerate mutase [Clostridiales bacterium]|nr:cofactor-independent phosphoglycerate mutase [Clostridiales bacterium]
MKYILVLLDGMADFPIDSLGGKTPVEAARTPSIDRLLKTAEIGTVKTVPDGMSPGSDVANLSVLGYDPSVYYSGRSPLEALSIGVNLGDDDMAVRCNLVTLSEDDDFESKTMVDYSAGEITTPEAKELMQGIEEKFGTKLFKFYGGVSYRHCLVVNGGAELKDKMTLTPPHNITGKKIAQYLPKGELSKEFIKLYKESYKYLSRHEINIQRIQKGLRPANCVWLWGQGVKPKLESFEERYGKKGAIISAVDLLKGIAIGAGMKSIDVEGATGTLNTNFSGKAKAAIEALKENDFCFIHLEAPDECGHHGNLKGKIKSIELIDEKVIGAIVSHFERTGEEFAMLITPDHYTPISTMTHDGTAVPYLMFSSKQNLGGAVDYSEKEANRGRKIETQGELIRRFFALK